MISTSRFARTLRRAQLLSRAAIGMLALVAATSNIARAGTIMFEDNWPTGDDGDFNDEVVAYNYSETTNLSGMITGLHATYNVLAVGGIFHNGLYLHLPGIAATDGTTTETIGQGSPPVTIDPVANESDLVIPLVSDTRSLFSSSIPSTSPINTDPTQARVTGDSIQVDIDFTTPVQLALSDAPFDLYIARPSPNGRSREIHKAQFSGTSQMDTSLFDTGDDASTPNIHFVNKNGLPFALDIPDSATPLSDPNLSVYPSEGTSIALAYPELSDESLAANGGSPPADWFNHPDESFLFSPVPEPSSVLLGGIGMAALLATANRRRKELRTT